MVNYTRIIILTDHIYYELSIDISFLGLKIHFTDVLAASNVYTDIAQALQNATDAASNARSNALDAFAVVDPASQNSLVSFHFKKIMSNFILSERNIENQANEANFSLAKSVGFNARVEEALTSFAVGEQNARIETNLSAMGDLATAVEKNLTGVKGNWDFSFLKHKNIFSFCVDMQQSLEDHQDRIKIVVSLVDSAHSGLAEIEAAVSEFNTDVDDLTERADVIQNFTQASYRITSQR